MAEILVRTALKMFASRSLRSYRTIQGYMVPVSVFLLNVLLAYPLFTGEYTQHLGSIEASFIADSRFITENLGSNWNPLWYCGFPFHLAYTPLIPYFVALIHMVTPIVSFARAYRLVTAVAYALGPVSFYLFVKYLTRREFTAILASIIYTIGLPYPYETMFLGSNATSGVSLAPSRLVALTAYGEGPHIVGLTIIPLSAQAFIIALRRPSFKTSALAALTASAVALINLIALYALAQILVVILLSEGVLGDGVRKLKVASFFGMMTYGLVAFMYDWSFVQASQAFGERGLTLPWYAWWLAFAFLLATAAALYNSLKDKDGLQPWFVCSLWAATFLTMVGLRYLFEITLVPQPYRYVPELEMGVSMLSSVAITRLHDGLRGRRSRIGRRAISSPSVLFIGTMLILLALPMILFFQSVQVITQPNTDIRETAEYTLAHWLAARVGYERVYATGTTAFWLNVFSDVSQVRGGTDQGATNPFWAPVATEINVGSNGTLGMLWLRALNVRYVVVNYPNADTPYVDYVYPHKFEGMLPLRYFYKGFGVFEVPLRRGELVQTVDVQAARLLGRIDGIADIKNLFVYVEFVERSTVVARYDYTMQNVDNIIIRVYNFTATTGVLVKMTYDDRWRAYVDGVPVKIEPVGPHFMLVEPEKAGSYELRLICSRTTSEAIGLGLTAATVIFLASVHLIRWARPRLNSARRLRSNTKRIVA